MQENFKYKNKVNQKIMWKSIRQIYYQSIDDTK